MDNRRSRLVWVVALGLLVIGTAWPVLAQGVRGRNPSLQSPRLQIPRRRPVPANHLANTPAGQRRAIPAPRPQVLPNPIRPLTPTEQRHLDQVLTQWQTKSSQIKTFQCDFYRYQYNKTFLQDPNVAWTQSKGEIKYYQPDKGLFRIIEIGQYTKPAKPGGKPTYPMMPGEEHWHCDGMSLYEFDHKQKLLIQRDLPPDMRGRSVLEGSLPFLFGVKKKELSQSYWLKVLPTKQQNLIKIVAYPKHAADAANFSSATIYLTRKYVPAGLVLEMPGGNERTSYQFIDPKIADPLRIAKLTFPQPKVPFGWKKQVQPFPVGDPKPKPAQAAAPQRAARRPQLNTRLR